jgi:hypothetical protein
MLAAEVPRALATGAARARPHRGRCRALAVAGPLALASPPWCAHVWSALRPVSGTSLHSARCPVNLASGLHSASGQDLATLVPPRGCLWEY